MPQLNPVHPSQYVAGGAGGVVSVTGTRIFPPQGSASGWNWLTPDSILTTHFIDGQPGVKLLELDITGTVLRTLLSAAGITYAVGGGGHWTAATIDQGVILDGQPVEGIAPICYGHDGTLAWFPWDRQGLWLASSDGGLDAHLSDAACQDVQVHGWFRCSWREGSRIRAVGLEGFPTDPQTVGPAFGWLRTFLLDGVWWLAYQVFDRTDLSVVAHPAHDASRGKILAASGLCYRLDCNGTIAVWSAFDRDLPEDIRVVTLADLPMVSLTAAPIPVPQPDPEPEPMPDSIESTVEEMVQQYGLSEATKPTIINAAAWAHRADGWGLSAKPGGHHGTQPGTGIAVATDILHHKPSDTLWDALTDTGTMWAQAAPHNDPNRPWVAPVAPIGAPPDEPGEPQPGGTIDAAVQALITAALASVQETVESLEQRIAALEDHATEPGPSFPEKIALKSAHGKYVAAEENGTLIANRDSAGAWEEWTVEPK